MKLFLCLAVGVLSVQASNAKLVWGLTGTSDHFLVDESLPQFKFTVTDASTAANPSCFTSVQTLGGILQNVCVVPSITFKRKACSTSRTCTPQSNCVTDADFVGSSYSCQLAWNLDLATVQIPSSVTTKSEYTCSLVGTIFDDNIVEDDECFLLEISDVTEVSGQKNYDAAITTTVVAGVIATATWPAVPEIWISGSETGATVGILGNRADESTKALTFQVTLSHPNALAANFNLVPEVCVNNPSAWMFQCAEVGKDFVTTATGYQVNPNTITSTHAVVLIDDLVQELDETFAVTISATDAFSQKYSVTNAKAIGTITDNEQVKIAFKDYSKKEGDQGQFMVQLSHGLSFGSKLNMRVFNTSGSAIQGKDYTLPTGGFAQSLRDCPTSDGSSCQNYLFDFTIIDDAVIEIAETFGLKLTAGPAQNGGSFSVPADPVMSVAQTVVQTAIFSLVDDPTKGFLATSGASAGGIEKPFVINSNEDAKLTIADATAAEDVGKVTFNVFLSHVAETDLFFATEDVKSLGNCKTSPCPVGLADVSTDISGPSTGVKFLTGSKAASFDVLIINDDVQEASESFRVAIKPAPQNDKAVESRVDVSKAFATGKITDDEGVTVSILDSIIVVPPVTTTPQNSESLGAVKFSVALSHSYDTALRFDFSLVDGSSVCGLDYSRILPSKGPYGPCTDADRTVVVPEVKQGAKTFDFNVFVVNDAIEEASETFTVKLAAMGTSAGSSNGLYQPYPSSSPVSKITATGTIQEWAQQEMATLKLSVGSTACPQPTVIQNQLVYAPCTTVSETVGKVTLDVTLSHPISQNLDVTWSTVDGTAKGGRDFVAVADQKITFAATPQVVAFSPNDFNNKQSISIDIMNDQVVEADETFTVQIKITDKDTFETVSFAGSSDQVVIRLESDDSATVGFDLPSQFQGNEQDGYIKFTMALSHEVEGGTSVSFSTMENKVAGFSSGFATIATTDAQVRDKQKCGGPDVSLKDANGVLMFAPNTKVAQWKLAVIDDHCQELTESFEVSITSVTTGCQNVDLCTSINLKGGAAAVTVGADAKAIGYISDFEDAKVSVDAINLKEMEGRGLERFEVKLSHPSEFPVNVEFKFASFADETLSAATVDCSSSSKACNLDFVLVFPPALPGAAANTGLLTFASGETTSSMIIQTNNDNIVELTEGAALNFTPASSVIGVDYPAGKTHFAVTVESDDKGTVYVPATSAYEAAGAKMEFRVHLSHPVDTDVIATYSTEPCTSSTTQICASAQDFTVVKSATSSVAKNDLYGLALVDILNDDTQECDEAIQLKLASLSTDAKWSSVLRVADTAYGIGTIMDDEPNFMFKNVQSAAAEGKSPLTWSLELSHALSVDATLTWQANAPVADAVATPGVASEKDSKRYEQVVSNGATAIQFKAANKKATVNPSVPLVNDAVFSPDQSFTVTVQEQVGTCQGLFSKNLPKLIGVVEDDEDATIFVEKVEIAEGAGAGSSLTVKLSHSISSKWPLDVKWALLEDASTDARAADFSSPVTGALTFTADKKSFQVSSVPILDSLTEFTEKFTLAFTPNSSYSRLKTDAQFPTITSQDKSVLTITKGRKYLEVDEMYTFDVTLDKATGTAFTANFTCTGENAPKVQVVSFAGETGETQTVMVPRDANDEVVEGAKDFPGFPCSLVVDPRYTGVVTVKYPGDKPDSFEVLVVDDDVASITVASTTAMEGGDVKFTISLSNKVDTDVNVYIYTEDGTAKAGADYTAIPKGTVVTIKSGAVSASTSVKTATDDLLEGDQTIILAIEKVEAAKRNVNVMYSKIPGIINDANKGVLMIASLAPRTVSEEETLSFDIKIVDAANNKKALITEADLRFSYQLNAGGMDRSVNDATRTGLAVHCVDFNSDHCVNGVLDPVKQKANPLSAAVSGGKSAVTVNIQTLADGEVDYTNELSFQLTGTVFSGGAVTVQTDKVDCTITDKNTPCPAFELVTEQKTAEEGKQAGFTVQCAKDPYRRDKILPLVSSSVNLIAGLDYPKFESLTYPGGKKSFEWLFTVPDNQQVVANFPFEVRLRDAKVVFMRIDREVTEIQLEPSRSTLTNEEGGSGLQVVYKLALPVRGAAPVTFLSGYDGENDDHTLVSFVSKVMDHTVNGVTYKMAYVPSGVRSLWFDRTGDVVVRGAASKGFPAKLKLTKVVPKPVYIPELCRAPLTTGPKDAKNRNVKVLLTPGETNTFWPGTCFFYPQGTDTAFWNSEFKATQAGPEVEIKNPDAPDMSVKLTVVSKPRTRVVLADQGDKPFVLTLFDQVDLDIVVADKLFLYQCNMPGKRCCNLVNGENIVTKCNVDERVFRDAPVWASEYDYDVSGIVRVSLKSMVPGLSRQCFGFAPTDMLYPNGFCLNVLVPEPPIVGYIQKQVVVQGARLKAEVPIMSGTQIVADDRTSPYRASVYCVKGCGASSASLSTSAGTWFIEIQGSDTNYGDSQYIVVVSDLYYSSVSYPIDVRVIRAGTYSLNTKNQC